MIHQTSDVQTRNIGSNTHVWQFCVILSEAKIGDDCNINSHVFIENNAEIGNKVTIKSGVQIWDGITIKDDVFIGPNVTFTNDFLPRSKQYPQSFLKTTVNQGASIGANATIIGGLTIGKYAMIGAGSLVSKDVGDNELWYGNPARFHGYVCQCGQKCDKSRSCKTCK